MSSSTQPVFEALRLGQSFWYDTLSRHLIESGELATMVKRGGLRGVTSNPTIFEKAMGGSADYLPALRRLAAGERRDPKALYETLAIADIRDAADILHESYIESDRGDGFVSLEVSPYLGHDPEGTITEARRLFAAVDRENVMIKVPGTRESGSAIAALIGEGINVNVTLLFGLENYRACAEAYLQGLERFVAGGGDPKRVAGVASFFLSRIDGVVDAQAAGGLDKAAPDKRAALERLPGRVAIANAKLAYVHYQSVIASDRWKALAARGAHPQRLLWASTGPKNPSYPKTLYVDALMGSNTVSTVPEETWKAFLAGGPPRATLTEGVPEARATLQALKDAGISLDLITDELVEKGLKSFQASFDKVLAAVDRQYQSVLAAGDSAHP